MPTYIASPPDRLLRIAGWREGVDRPTCIKALTDFGYGPRTAGDIVHAVLNGDHVCLVLDHEIDRDELQRKLFLAGIQIGHDERVG